MSTCEGSRPATRRVWLVSGLVFALLLAGVVLRPALATEAFGRLHLEVRLLEVSRGADSAAGVPAGTARIEILVRSLDPAEGLSLRIEHPDGAEWAMDPPMAGRVLSWARRPTEPPAEFPNGSFSLEARGHAATYVEVPLEGAAIHEILVEATGQVGGESVRAGAMVEAPLGVEWPGRLDNDAIQFDAVEGGQP